MKQGRRRVTASISPRWSGLSVLTAVLLLSTGAYAGDGTYASGIVYDDIAAGDGAGITYRRAPSATKAAYDAQLLAPLYDLRNALATPLKPFGQPGIALFDYDDDGDLDIYVTNGPGTHNSLYQNQRVGSGQTTFVEMAIDAGVDATDMDSTGVCYGDVDNDGDHDLLVLGRMESNRFFQNEGDGSFTEITATSGLGGGVLGHTGCSMGDINGDGLLDVFVANSFDWSRKEAIITELFGYNHPNQLFVNQGGNTFADVSVSAGIRNLGPVPSPTENSTITWASAMVDYDLDGDLDIMHADDQAGQAPSQFRGIDRGFIQIFSNDGAGNFANVTFQSGTAFVAEAWMGLAYGDINCDGAMDMFGTSVGDYMDPQLVGAPIPLEFNSSIWHLGTPVGFFQRGTFGELVSTPFGWGTGMADYDNDGFTDIVFYGGMDVGMMIDLSNPGTILHNQGCSGQMAWDKAATAPSAGVVGRSETFGVALGDLNDDGFVDITHVAAQYAGPSVGVTQYLNLRFMPTPIPNVPGPPSPFNASANFVPMVTTVGPDIEGEWNGYQMSPGMLGVELSSANNGNGYVKATLRGSVGDTDDGKVNRDAIGAVVFFRPDGGQQVMSPVLGGSSHASQHDLTQMFGLGAAAKGTVEVLWPGGVRNRLYDVASGERVTLPEIPCSFNGTWANRDVYKQCVTKALNDLKHVGAVNNAQRLRARASALRAYDDTH
jgi:enediyne biosynthesis protein E4